MLGKSDSDVVKGTLASVKQHNLNHEVLTAEQIKVRFPVFQPDNDEIGIFESEAGYLNPEKCVNAYQLMAGHFGAQLHFHESVASWKEVLHETMGVIIEVSTDSGRVVHTRKLVLAVGAWAPQVYGSVLPMDLYAERRVLYWFQPTAHVKKFKVIYYIVCFYYVYYIYIFSDD